MFLFSISFLINTNSNQLDQNIGDVTLLNGSPPTSNSPADFNTTTVGTETIGWILSYENDPGYYSVIANDTNGVFYTWIPWQPWEKDVSLDVPVNRTALGVFNYTILYNHSSGWDGVPDTVLVTVTPSSPEPDNPNDINTTTVGTEVITWTISNHSGHYRVYANDTNGNEYVWEDWNTWTNGMSFNVPINRTAIGIYNYTLWCNNTYDNATDTVIVNITAALPVPDNPADIIKTTVGNEVISWTIANHAGHYRVYVNDTNGNEYVWQEWNTWTDDVSFNIPINRTAVGVFNYTLWCNNTYGENTSTVIVTVTAYSPPPVMLTLGDVVIIVTIIVGPAGAIVGIAFVVMRKQA